jgi:D-glycero-D-manno-heptose 1,7-bisphosphate phosphatase
MSKRRAAFLDRDGTIIADPGYLRSPDDVRLLPGAAPALNALHHLGYALVVVSNRAGVARGLITPEEADAVHEAFVAALQAEGVELAGAYYCDHAPWDGCACRKPEPAMIQRAADALGLDVGQSVMIGNRPTDLEAGVRAGCPRGFLVSTDDSAASWADVVASISGPAEAV